MDSQSLFQCLPLVCFLSFFQPVPFSHPWPCGRSFNATMLAGRTTPLVALKEQPQGHVWPSVSCICVRVLFKAWGWPVLKHAPQKSSSKWLEQGFQLGCRSEPLARLLPGLLVSAKHLAGLRWRHPSGRCWAPGQPLLASEA